MAYGRLYGCDRLTLLYPHHAALGPSAGVLGAHRVTESEHRLEMATIDVAASHDLTRSLRALSAGADLPALTSLVVGLPLGGDDAERRKLRKHRRAVNPVGPDDLEFHRSDRHRLTAGSTHLQAGKPRVNATAGLLGNAEKCAIITRFSPGSAGAIIFRPFSRLHAFLRLRQGTDAQTGTSRQERGVDRHRTGSNRPDH
ncbi:conserved hypothetical protein [Ricinus communis]|uniref:Uncharacterized protein n=1 Tax=Ricinus communis TaxID=3988 RepID=B9TQ08_RICCO|nr:conserved hypothetical protein [Ricinus communis]